MISRGKRAKITPKGRELIILRSLEDPRIPRTILAEQLQRELEASGEDVPQVEVLERHISKHRNHATDNPQDKPWTTATLDKYPISPEVIPFLVNTGLDLPRPITIRYAKWASRLYAVTRDDEKSLADFADVYQWKERIAELDGVAFNSLPLDIELMNYAMGDREAALRLFLSTFMSALVRRHHEGSRSAKR
jgi:hypothetical protein